MRTWLPALLITASLPSMAASTPSYGPRLEGFAYPRPPSDYRFVSQNQSLEMGYLDVKPTGPANGRNVVLLHGKNFCGATWEGTIEALADAGYRVVAPDQIGFCRSSKPHDYKYTFEQLAQNTHQLLASLGIEHAVVVGHSMGGMLAARYALMYPQQTDRLVLVNPIGLEDWKAKGVPRRTVDEWYQRELKTTAQSIRKYQQSTYYANQWRPEFDHWVDMQAGMFEGDGKEAVAWSSAQTYEMIFDQPVFYDLEKLKVPTVLMIGQKDNTAIGKDAAPEPLRSQLGDYPALGRAAAARIAQSTLVEFAELGHAPQIQDPERFNAALLERLSP